MKKRDMALFITALIILFIPSYKAASNTVNESKTVKYVGINTGTNSGMNNQRQTREISNNVKGESYTITYYLNGGMNHKNNPAIYVLGDIINIHNPIKRGHRFNGWYIDSWFKTRFYGVDKNLTGNINLHAKWIANTYQITFYNRGVRLIKTKMIAEYGKTYETLPIVERKGYTFKGWYTKRSGGKKISKHSKVTILKDLKLYAQWRKILKPGRTTIFVSHHRNPKQINVKIKKRTGVKGYHILYSTDKNFKFKKSTYTTSLNKIIKKLKGGSIYYLKARAYKLDSANEKIFGSWSKTKKIKVPRFNNDKLLTAKDLRTIYNAKRNLIHRIKDGFFTSGFKPTYDRSINVYYSNNKLIVYEDKYGRKLEKIKHIKDDLIRFFQYLENERLKDCNISFRLVENVIVVEFFISQKINNDYYKSGIIYKSGSNLYGFLLEKFESKWYSFQYGMV